MISKIILIAVALLFSACATTTTKTQSINKQCLEIPNPGMCKAYFKKFYYDSKDEKCKSFVWGGCGGNIPFNTLDKCKSTCEK